METYNKLVIAHRGASAYEKDNSIESFSKAIEMGADMIEFDVRRTCDGVLVAQHDPTIRSKRIADITYAEIKTMDDDILTLKQVLLLARGKTKLDIELKELGYEKESVDLVLQYFNIDDFVMTSFKSGCLDAIKRYIPEIKLGFIMGNRQFKEYLIPVKLALDVGADYLVLSYILASEKLLKSAKDNGLDVLVWTVDDRQDLQHFLSDDLVDGVVTNYPDLAIQLRTDKK